MTLAPFPSRSSHASSLWLCKPWAAASGGKRRCPVSFLLLVLRLHLLRLTVVLLHELSALLFVHLTCCR